MQHSIPDRCRAVEASSCEHSTCTSDSDAMASSEDVMYTQNPFYDATSVELDSTDGSSDGSSVVQVDLPQLASEQKQARAQAAGKQPEEAPAPPLMLSVRCTPRALAPLQRLLVDGAVASSDLPSSSV